MILNEMFAEQQIGFPILSALIMLPIVVSVLIYFIRDEGMLRMTALIGAVLELLLAIVLVYHFIPGTADIQFAERAQWMQALGSGYHVGVDGISVLFLPLTAFITVMVMLFSWSSVRFFLKMYLINILIFEAVTIGIFVSLDLVLFFVFWELALIPVYFLIKFWGIGPERQFAGQKYVLYLLVGSVPLLIGILLLSLNYHEVALAQGLLPAYSFDFLTLLSVPVSLETQTLIFFLLAIGFAVKGPMLPFHTWLPTALMEGPIGVGMFLVGLKMGLYGFLRFLIPLVPEAAKEWFWLMAVLGVVGILYGGLIALIQPNMRRLQAFSGLSHVGLAVLGLFSLNVQGLQGALFMMLSFGIVATGLFCLTGFLHTRLGSSDITAFGGLARQVPRLATFFFILGLASIGTPGTIGFHGEFLILLGAFKAQWQFTAVAVLGVILSASCFLWYYERAFFGPITNKVVLKIRDLTPREMVVGLSVSALVLWVGFYPAPVLNITSASIEAVAKRVQEGSLTRSVQAVPQPVAHVIRTLEP